MLLKILILVKGEIWLNKIGTVGPTVSGVRVFPKFSGFQVLAIFENFYAEIRLNLPKNP